MRTGLGGQRPELHSPGEVHAWLIDLDAPVGADRLLDPAELDRATSYLRQRDGARFAASRAWLRMIVGRYLDADPGGLRFVTGAAGRPALAGDHAGPLHFSLSRSAKRALVAVSNSPVGADIEVVSARAGLADLVAGRFGPAEARCIAGGCGGSPLRGFYRHWTAKEAYLKATGAGLAGLRATELICGARPAVRVGGEPATGWTISLVKTAPDCNAAIVGGGPVSSYWLAPQ
jgi:4'-phosphopantetheinyl transferase